MKPASPEQRELEALGAEVSARYRAADDAQPSAGVDAVILEAARREARRPVKRNWHLPASIAAMLVIGVSLALVTREIEDPLPPLDSGAGRGSGEPASGAGVERPVAERPGAAHRAEPAAQARPDNAEPLSGRETRLSRERSTREQAELEYRAPQPAGLDAPAAPTAAQGQPATEAQGSEAGTLHQRKALADAEQQAQSTAEPPEDWLERIEVLRREGRATEAEQELARFRQRHPDYPLPQGLREWSDRRKP